MQHSDWLDKLKQYFWPDPEAGDILAASERVSDASRRRFLRTALLGATLAATVDVEQLLWAPGDGRLWMPGVGDEDGIEVWDNKEACYNRLITDEWFTREALQLMKADLEIIGRVHRRYDKKVRWPRQGSRIGDSLAVRIPKRFDVNG